MLRGESSAPSLHRGSLALPFGEEIPRFLCSFTFNDHQLKERRKHSSSGETDLTFVSLTSQACPRNCFCSKVKNVEICVLCLIGKR